MDRQHRTWVAFFAIMLIPLCGTALPGRAAADAVGSGGVFVGVTYARVFDTASPGMTKLTANETRLIQIAGKYGVPSTGVGAVLVDIAATSATDSETFAWLWSSGSPRPSAPALRFGTDTVPRSNTVAVALGPDGKLALQNYQGTTGINIDIQGYFTAAGSSGPAPGGFVPVEPVRALDTQNGIAISAGQLAGGSTSIVQIGGTNGVPLDAKAVFASIEVSYINSDGNLRIRAYGDATTTLPAFEYSTGAPERSSASLALSGDGRIEIKNLGSQDVHLKIDVEGYFAGGPSEGGGFTVSTQANLFDSTVSSRLNPGETRTFSVGGAANVPTYGAAGAMVTVTAFGWSSSGGLEFYRTGTGHEAKMDSLTFSTSDASSVSSTTVIRPGDNGKVSIVNHSSGTLHARVFLQGWFQAERAIPSAAEANFRTSAASILGVSQSDTLIEQAIYDSNLVAQIEESASDPSPATPTTYGVDSDTLEDLQSFATIEQKPISTEVAEYKFQEAFGVALERLKVADSNFSWARVQGTTAEVSFKGVVPADAASYFANIEGAGVTLVGGQALNADEIGLAKEAAINNLLQEYGANLKSAKATWDKSNGRVAVAANVSGIPSGTQTTETVVQGTSVSTKTTFKSDPVTASNAALRGGVRLNWTDGGWCTSGFPVHVENSDTNGLITARHCQNPAPRYGNRSTPALGAASRFLDWEDGDIQFHPTVSGEAAGYSFYSLPTRRRLITGTKAVNEGDKVCMFGRRSNGYVGSRRTCALVKDENVFGYWADVGVMIYGLTDVDAKISDHGDSGGPVFLGGKAIGIIQGTDDCGLLWTDECSTFTPATAFNDSPLDVVVNVAP